MIIGCLHTSSRRLSKNCSEILFDAIIACSAAMTSSPTKNAQLSTTSGLLPTSPRSPGKLRKLQSAHQLSSHYTGSSGPSLISQQRQQQQRNASAFDTPPVPTIPPQHSPQRQVRTRSNSDLALNNATKPAGSPKKPAIPKRTPIPKDARYELESLIRQGPKDNVPLALQNLRHWVLCDGINADSDGMVHSSNVPSVNIKAHWCCSLNRGSTYGSYS